MAHFVPTSWARLVARLLAVALLVASMTVGAAPDAAAHAELRQASPRVGSTVGGTFHSVSMQFSGLDTDAGFRAELLDPGGMSIGQPAVAEKQRIVIPIEPLSVPGVYTVSYTTIGEDGDVESDVFTFRYDPAAPEPEGIDIEITTVERVGWFGYALLLVGAALLGYLAHRVRSAWKAQNADRAIVLEPEDGDGDGIRDEGAGDDSVDADANAG